MELDDITQAVAGATSTAGVTEACECDQGSRARDREIENHALVSEENWGAYAPRVSRLAPSPNTLVRFRME